MDQLVKNYWPYSSAFVSWVDTAQETFHKISTAIKRALDTTEKMIAGKRRVYGNQCPLAPIRVVKLHAASTRNKRVNRQPTASVL